VTLTDYCGAGSRITLDAALRLDPKRWAIQPKQDGCYVRITTDRRGRIASMLCRSGRPPGREDVADLIGVVAGPADAVLHGELEASTEAGVRARATRGFALVHLFDATRYQGRPVGSLPYQERYGLLHRAQARVEQEGVVDPWTLDDQGDAHDLATGRYVPQVPRDQRRCPVVPQVRGRAATEQLWASYVEQGGEGLVAVALDAPQGRRGCKRKIKASSTLDCAVLACSGGAAVLEYGGQTFAVSARGRWAQLVPGQVVECQHDGWYEAGATPRFARIIRVRSDLA
jgi:hypothetical protein